MEFTNNSYKKHLISSRCFLNSSPSHAPNEHTLSTVKKKIAVSSETSRSVAAHRVHFHVVLERN